MLKTWPSLSVKRCFPWEINWQVIHHLLQHWKMPVQLLKYVRMSEVWVLRCVFNLLWAITFLRVLALLKVTCGAYGIEYVNWGSSFKRLQYFRIIGVFFFVLVIITCNEYDCIDFVIVSSFARSGGGEWWVFERLHLIGVLGSLIICLQLSDHVSCSTHI